MNELQKRNLLALLGVQATQPDKAHLFLKLGNPTGEVEHQAVLDGIVSSRLIRSCEP